MLASPSGHFLAFSIVQVAECVVAASAGSHGAAHATGEHAHSESVHSAPEGIRLAGHQCHHNAGHQHQDAADKAYASPRRGVDPGLPRLAPTRLTRRWLAPYSCSGSGGVAAILGFSIVSIGTSDPDLQVRRADVRYAPATT